MRVLLVNTSERVGGAAVASYRLTEALKNNGVKAKLLVRNKQTDNVSTVELEANRSHLWKFVWERIVIWKANHFKKNNLFAVDIANTGTDITSLPEFQEADVIHLHWINQGMLSLKNIRKIGASGKPVVWTMHDMWSCTGICHHACQCTRYQEKCGNCPYIYGEKEKDLSYRIFQSKKKLYQKASIVFIACSRWLEESAKGSALLSGQVIINIPNPININLFKPRNKKEARVKCNFPLDKKLILFNSVKITDKRKGIDYLVESCKILAEKYPELKKCVEIVILGHKSEQSEQLSLPFRTYSLPFVNKESELVPIYNAVDLYVIPSLEENLPNTIMEAMACGVPCVGFDTGGIPEMIDHLHNGYVAQYKSVEDFATGIYWILTDSGYSVLSEQARRKVVSNYSEEHVAKKYIEIYNKLTGHRV
ncbi:N N'-diacetylbacillosaminyl-diphospho-undecaprenol alpha-1 3-N-acetylgalactosaminyltransferase [termite gut metagenome]|uniref:N N'-diacetylbacillosaminyl-diphospho-undecaprenol alpha-1 3-N-acetylgalactosaminyltransferase n=1 Tax=termite gut metagenome TaxID=433724 RepID=A0A5J4RHD3_9ZZZZ